MMEEHSIVRCRHGDHTLGDIEDTSVLIKNHSGNVVRENALKQQCIVCGHLYVYMGEDETIEIKSLYAKE